MRVAVQPRAGPALASGLFALAVLAWPLDTSPSPAELTSHIVHVNGVDLFYRIGGTGPPLLLVHGFTRVGHDWDDFLDELGQHFTVIVPDLRGHGLSATGAAEFGYPEAARDMLGLLDHLRIKRCKAIGHSAGGITLLHMAGQQPERLEAMVLVSATHRFTPEAREACRAFPTLEELPFSQREAYREIHPGGEPQIRWLLSQIRSWAQGFVDLGPERLAAIPTRTLVVWGDRDDNLPLALAVELYQALPAASLWVVPGQGHLPIWDHGLAAEMFPRLVQEFLLGESAE